MRWKLRIKCSGRFTIPTNFHNSYIQQKYLSHLCNHAMKSHNILMFFSSFLSSLSSNYHHYYHNYHCNHHYNHQYFFCHAPKTWFWSPKKRGPSCPNWGVLNQAMPESKRLFSADVFRYLPQHNKCNFKRKECNIRFVQKYNLGTHIEKQQNFQRRVVRTLFLLDCFKGVSLFMTKYKSGCKRCNIRLI